MSILLCGRALCVVFLASLVSPIAASAEADEAKETKTTQFTFSGYADVYYLDDFSPTPFSNREITPSGLSPVYSFAKQNRFDLNHALVDAKFTTDSVRGALGIQAGTYVETNYANENSVVRHLFEAQIGFKPGSAPIWIDAGIFSSHIGLESAVSKDDWTPTRSIMADNTPYYESGVKVTWDPNARWEYTLLLLQGWQEIDSQSGNKAVGTEIIFKPTDAWVVNSSTYLGQSPNSRARLRRYFHDFYITWQATKTWAFALSTDVGFDQTSVTNRSLQSWISATFLARWQFAQKWSATARAEAYHDPHGLTLATGTPNNFVALGESINLDWHPSSSLLVRLELRSIRSRDQIFIDQRGPSDLDSFATVSTAVSF